jgi:hypothetical protein
VSDDIDWDEIRDEDRAQDRWDDDEQEPEERAPDDVIRRDNAAAINEWLRRR